MITRRVVAVVAVVAVAVATVTVVTGCGGSKRDASKPSDPAVVAERDYGRTHVVNFPNSFPNVAWRCVGPDKVFVSTKTGGGNAGGHLHVIANHSECRR